MTGSDRPEPPASLDPAARDALATLGDRDPETLRHAAAYLEALAEWTETDDDSEYPTDVPERASVSTTEIGGTSYRYFQWREGDEIRSRTEPR